MNILGKELRRIRKMNRQILTKKLEMDPILETIKARAGDFREAENSFDLSRGAATFFPFTLFTLDVLNITDNLPKVRIIRLGSQEKVNKCRLH